MSYNSDSTGNLVECIQPSYPKRGQDWIMPVANIIRIMRKVLPVHAKIADDAKETIQQCVSEFISFITSEANDKCQREQRKTITADDILWAALKLGFDDYIEPLSIYLKRYREIEGDHRGSIRGEPLPLSLQMNKKDESDLTIISAVYGGDCGGMEVPPSAYQASNTNASRNDGNSCSLPISYYAEGEKGATIPVAATYSHYRI